MYLLESNNLTFGYDKDNLTIHNLSLSVPQGAIYGFLGHNGAGKSTTIRLLLGLMRPFSGAVNIFGLPLATNAQAIYKRVGALIESPSLYDHLSATDNLRVTATYYQIGQRRIEEVLNIVGLATEGKKPVKSYSTGMKQRLGLASALLNDPELIILDEPANGLDPQGIVELRTIIQRLNTDFGKTIFLSSHILSEIEVICSHIGIIKKGKKLFEGTIDALKAANTEGVIVSLETTDKAKTVRILADRNVKVSQNGNPNAVLLELSDKSAIPSIAAQLVQNDIGIYEVKIKNQRLEDLFLTLTEHEK
jgi:lantibiotic transport system ATP-binding protein